MSAFNVLLVGAGEINFGSVEGAWNHTLRLEKKLGARLRVVALVDPDQDKGRSQLKAKQEDLVGKAYEQAQTFKSVEAAAQTLPEELKPRMAILGVPPIARGSMSPGADLELQMLKHFPGCALFVEKPITNTSAEDAYQVAARLREHNVMTSVGYMTRYQKAVSEMRRLIHENQLTVMAVRSSYYMAYEFARKPGWWNKAKSHGPVVEQATHFADLSRFLAGEVDLSSILVHTVEHDEKPGQLSKIGIDENQVPPDQRVPRFTSAVFKFDSGAVGTLLHAVALHDNEYQTEIEVIADGWHLRLVDPYGLPTLHVKKPGVPGVTTQSYSYDTHDPFFEEISVFIDAIETGDQSKVLSTYEDAAKTFDFTWKIREASDRQAAQRRK